MSVYSLYVNIDTHSECLYYLRYVDIDTQVSVYSVYVNIDTQSECCYSLVYNMDIGTQMSVYSLIYVDIDTQGECLFFICEH